eukprot:6078997-Lingulodinium_polyedra.AAC.1
MLASSALAAPPVDGLGRRSQPPPGAVSALVVAARATASVSSPSASRTGSSEADRGGRGDLQLPCGL